MKKSLLILLLLGPLLSFGQYAGSFWGVRTFTSPFGKDLPRNQIILVSDSVLGDNLSAWYKLTGSATRTQTTAQMVAMDSAVKFAGGYFSQYWQPYGTSWIMPNPSTKMIRYPGMPSYNNPAQPNTFKPVWYDTFGKHFTLYNRTGLPDVPPGDTISGCDPVYNYVTDNQNTTIEIDSIANVCGCFTFVNTGANSVVSLESIEDLPISGTASATVTSGQVVFICPNETNFVVIMTNTASPTVIAWPSTYTPTNLLNDQWMQSYSYNGDTANILKISQDNIIEFGQTVGINALYHVLNSGVNDIVNIPVSSASPSGTEHGVGITVGNNRILKVSAMSDGAGSVTTKTVRIDGSLSLPALVADATPDSMVTMVGGIARMASYSWNSLPGIPATFTATAHTQDWSTILNVPGTYTPTAHTQDWTTITSVPAAYTPTTITLSGDITGSGQNSISTTLATVNIAMSGVNSITVNAKGLVTSSTVVSYQAPLTNPVTGTGVSGYIPHFTGTSTIDSSALYYDALNKRLGVGTASPLQKLHITDTYSFLVIPGSGGTGEMPEGIVLAAKDKNLSFMANQAGGTAGDKITMQYFNGTGWKSGLEIANVASGYGSMLLMKSGGKVAIGGTAPGSTLGVYGNLAVGANYAVEAAPTNGLIVEGNVGVGTVNPGVKLDIIAIAPQIRIQNTVATSATYVNFLNTGGNSYFGSDNSTGTGLMATGGLPYGLAVGHSGAYPVSIFTNNISRISVLSSGKVGIGITTPLSTLHTVGSIRATDSLLVGSVIKIAGGSPGAGKFLSSDVDGLGSWSLVPWSSLSGVPSTFTVSTHTQPWSTITAVPSTYTPTILAHNTWFQSYDYAGNLANLFKLSPDNVIELGQPLAINSLYHVLNSGVNEIVSIPVSSASPSGTEHGVGITIGGSRILKVSAMSDGAGAVTTKTVVINGMAKTTSLTITSTAAGTASTDSVLVSNITVKKLPPNTFAAYSHTQGWSTITGVPSTFTPTLGGTDNYIQKKSGTALVNSTLTDDGSTVTVLNSSLNATGTTGTVTVSGAGTRLMWIPSKGAFRAGVITGTTWDNANIGNWSFATSYNSKASGVGSSAFYGSIASGTGSFAAGEGEAKGINSFAFGALSVAQNESCIAIGDSAVAGSVSYAHSIALGEAATADGEACFATGWRSHASGLYGNAIGAYAHSNGSTSIGVQTYSSNGALAMGALATATGAGSIAIGVGNEATAYKSISLGRDIISGGKNSIAIGLDSTRRTLSQASTLSVMGGKVGFGTTTPTCSVEIGGTDGYYSLDYASDWTSDADGWDITGITPTYNQTFCTGIGMYLYWVGAPKTLSKDALRATTTPGKVTLSWNPALSGHTLTLKNYAGSVTYTTITSTGSTCTDVTYIGELDDGLSIELSNSGTIYNLKVYTLQNKGDLKVNGSIVVSDTVTGPNFRITPEGGYAVKFTAATTLAQGDVVTFASANTVTKTNSEYSKIVGVAYSSAATSTTVWVVVSGIALVNFNDDADDCNQVPTVCDFATLWKSGCGYAIQNGKANVSTVNSPYNKIGIITETKSNKGDSAYVILQINNTYTEL